MREKELKQYNLLRIMKNKNIDRKELSILTGKSKQQLSNILTGRDKMGTQLIQEFSEVLQVDEDEFVKQPEDERNKNGPLQRINDENMTEHIYLDEVMAYGSEEDKQVVRGILKTLRDNARLKKGSSLPN